MNSYRCKSLSCDSLMKINDFRCRLSANLLLKKAQIEYAR